LTTPLAETAPHGAADPMLGVDSPKKWRLIVSTLRRARIARRFPLTIVVSCAASLAIAAVPRADAACDVTFAILQDVTLGSLTFAVDYTTAQGEFRGTAENVECTILPAVETSFAADGDQGFMTVMLSDSVGFSGPADIARCVFDPDPGAGNPVAGDFSYPSVIALEPGYPPVPVVIDNLVGVSSIECSAGPTTTTTLPSLGDCGDPGGGGIAASDALFALLAAVGGQVCPACLCDVNGDGSVTATDALVILKRAVGQSVTLACPSCL
jgi:hypothetical protein